MIVHYRVDERVIHGQTTTKITKEVHVDGIIIVDDKIAGDKFMMQLYKQILPSHIKVFSFSIEKAPKKLSEAEKSNKNYVVIMKTPLTARKMVEGGYNFKNTLFIGPQSVREGSTFIMQMVGLMPNEMEALDYLESNKTTVIVNPTFTTPTLTWSEAKGKI